MQVLHTLIPIKTRIIRNDYYSDTKSVSWMKKRRKNMYTNAKRRNSAQLMEACKKLDKKIFRQIKLSNRQIVRKSFYVVQKDYCKVIGLQWIAKQNISPLRLYKTAKDKDAKNYRPISNLCAASKIFESDTCENHRDRENKEALQRRPQKFKQKWRT